MIVDFDDYNESNDAMPWLLRLKEANPAFRCTLFAVPAHGSPEFWASHPDWVELAVHGWDHGGPGCPDPYEASAWSYDRAAAVLAAARRLGFTRGWKSPGWQISDGTYQACLDAGFWVADQHLEDHRRPKGLPTYFYEDGDDRWHGHVQNVCQNGIEETWDRLLAAVTAATEFRFCSEATVVWDG